MNRPMPGPPECGCSMVPPHLWTTHYGAVDPVTMIEYNPDCPVHGDLQLDKRLTDAECAAHYWQADADYERLTDLDNSQAEFDEHLAIADTWHRFATHPHALEVQE